MCALHSLTKHFWANGNEDMKYKTGSENISISFDLDVIIVVF